MKFDFLTITIEREYFSLTLGEYSRKKNFMFFHFDVWVMDNYKTCKQYFILNITILNNHFKFSTK